MKKKLSKTTLAALASSACLTISGCSYLDRHDGISTHAGDALAANEANMVVDPWPDQFDDAEFDSDGERMSGAVTRYKKGSATPAGNPVRVNK